MTEEEELFVLIDDSDTTISQRQAAESVIVSSHLRIAAAMARKFLKGLYTERLDIDDLIEEGAIAIVLAIPKYRLNHSGPTGGDVSRRPRFSTYVSPRIFQAIKRCVVKNCHALHFSEEIFNQIRNAIIYDDQSPEGRQLKALNQSALSLDSKASGNQALVERLGITDPVDETPAYVLSAEYRELLRMLQPHDRRIVELRVGIDSEDPDSSHLEPRVFKYIARDMGVSVSTVSTRYYRAITKLRYLADERGYT